MSYDLESEISGASLLSSMSKDILLIKINSKK